MLNRLAILTVVLAITGAFAPIPRKATFSPTQARDQIERQGQYQKTAPDPFVMLVDYYEHTPTEQNGANNPPHNNANQPVTVTEPVTVAITKGWRDELAWIFSGLLVVVGGVTGYLALRTLHSINHQAVLQFRPRLTLRRILIYKGTQIPTIEGKGDIPWRVGFNISNHGGSAAHIQECHFSLIRVESEFPPRPTHFEQSRPRPFSLAPGEERELSIEFDENMTNLFRLAGKEGLRQGWQDTDHIYFLGFAKYADDVGIVRSISICRHYQNATGRFKAIEDPDYEYAD